MCLQVPNPGMTFLFSSRNVSQICSKCVLKIKGPFQVDNDQLPANDSPDYDPLQFVNLIIHCLNRQFGWRYTMEEDISGKTMEIGA